MEDPGKIKAYAEIFKPDMMNESRAILFELGKHESVKKQKAIWEAFDVDYNKIRQESKELERQHKRMIEAKKRVKR